jgi:hypothetical protein
MLSRSDMEWEIDKKKVQARLRALSEGRAIRQNKKGGEKGEKIRKGQRDKGTK